VRLFSLFFLTLFSVSLFSSCPHVGWDQTVTLKEINDGDTVTLENGRLVRFIGINTPEINHRNKSKSDPYALQAKELLQRYIKAGDKLHLVFDKNKTDRYGRLLAYVYSQNGHNLGLLQLQSGFAAHWAIGKNDRFWQCFQTAERQARLRRQGIWSDFKPLFAANLEQSDKGYVYISGVVSDVKEGKGGLRFTLDRKLDVIIHAKQLKLFKKNRVDILLHDRLLVTGKLFFTRGQAKLTLYHPAQILP